MSEADDTAGGGRSYDPFAADADDAAASAYSCYAGILAQENPQLVEKLYRIPQGRLWPVNTDRRVIPVAQVAHDQMRATILSDGYPCLGAKAAFHRGSYRYCFYKELAHPRTALALGYDLKRFVREYKQLGEFSSFVAAFELPGSTSETSFERLLWRQLQMLHKIDESRWDPHYSPDPESKQFAFSFAGCAFFVVGMHQGASRASRRLAYPTVVFNPESQIHELKRQGKFANFAKKIRRRDELFQGSVNPSLPEDAASQENEARVYSGKEHRPGSAWKCPFRPRPEIVVDHEIKPVDLTPTVVPVSRGKKP